MQEKIKGHSLKESIAMAFNLGVWMKQQKGQTGNVSEAAKELRNMIYWNMSQQYSDAYPRDLLNANVEYFLEIALLGSILGKRCLPALELKQSELDPPEARVWQEAPQQPF